MFIVKQQSKNGRDWETELELKIFSSDKKQLFRCIDILVRNTTGRFLHTVEKNDFFETKSFNLPNWRLILLWPPIELGKS